jgi:hypothetical protein
MKEFGHTAALFLLAGDPGALHDRRKELYFLYGVRYLELLLNLMTDQMLSLLTAFDEASDESVGRINTDAIADT